MKTVYFVIINASVTVAATALDLPTPKPPPIPTGWCWPRLPSGKARDGGPLGSRERRPSL